MDRNILKKISYGMYIIGARDDKNVGCVVNTVFQITNNPVTIAVSINHDNYTNEVIKKTNKFSVSILDENINPEIIGVFGYSTSKDNDKYENINYELVNDVPILKDVCGNLFCTVVNQVETNTHTIFLAEVTDMINYQDKMPMTYKYYQEVLKGKSPKNAPTFEGKNEMKSKWKCKICGYETDIENLPEDYKCPICGAPIELFEKID